MLPSRVKWFRWKEKPTSAGTADSKRGVGNSRPGTPILVGSTAWGCCTPRQHRREGFSPHFVGPWKAGAAPGVRGALVGVPEHPAVLSLHGNDIRAAGKPSCPSLGARTQPRPAPAGCCIRQPPRADTHQLFAIHGKTKPSCPQNVPFKAAPVPRGSGRDRSSPAFSSIGFTISRLSVASSALEGISGNACQQE